MSGEACWGVSLSPRNRQPEFFPETPNLFESGYLLVEFREDRLAWEWSREGERTLESRDGADGRPGLSLRRGSVE